MCTHYWKLDLNDYGICKLCHVEKDFKPDVDKSWGIGYTPHTPHPVRKDFHYERNLIPTGGYCVQGAILRPIRTVDYHFSTDWLE